MEEDNNGRMDLVEATDHAVTHGSPTNFLLPSNVESTSPSLVHGDNVTGTASFVRQHQVESADSDGKMDTSPTDVPLDSPELNASDSYMAVQMNDHEDSFQDAT